MWLVADIVIFGNFREDLVEESRLQRKSTEGRECKGGSFVWKFAVMGEKKGAIPYL